MRYRVYNQTDLEIRELRRLISFAGADLDWRRGVVWVEVKHTQPQRQSGPYAASGNAWSSVEATLRIARDYPAPWFDRPKTKLELGMINDRREALVAVAAHELKHLSELQRGDDSPHRVIEDRCDAYAFSRLSAYREKVTS